VTAHGSASLRFRRALDRGNVTEAMSAAAEALEQALARYQRKENIFMTERVRGRLAEVQSSERAGERA
jgi:hypothetical protein